MSSVLCFLPSRSANEWFGSLEEARAAVPDILRRCEESPAETLEQCEQKTFFPDVSDSEPDFPPLAAKTEAVKREFPFPHLSENPNRAELYGRFFSLFFASRDHKVEEGDLLRAKQIQESPSTKKLARKLLQEWEQKGLVLRHKGPRGFSYTLNLNFKEGQKNDGSADCR